MAKAKLVKKTRKLKKTQPKKSYKKEKKLLIRTRVNLFYFIIICIFIAIGVLYLTSYKNNKYSTDLTASPIIHLIASISAQKEPIKINTEFSYKEGEAIKESPVRIVIPDVKIDASVIDAQIIDGFWETATNSASFGLGSAYPQELGNTVIFAHAIPGLFGNLNQVKKNMSIYLFTKTSWLRFKVLEIKSVYPNQIEVISPTKDKTLTLYTCTGFQDIYRLVVIAKPSN